MGTESLGVPVLNISVRDPAANGCPWKVFVGGLTQKVTPELLAEHFSKYGAITEAAICRDRNSMRSRGFGLVAFSTKAELEHCMANIDDHVICGKWVEVKRYDGNAAARGGGGRRGHWSETVPSPERAESDPYKQVPSMPHVTFVEQTSVALRCAAHTLGLLRSETNRPYTLAFRIPAQDWQYVGGQQEKHFHSVERLPGTNVKLTKFMRESEGLYHELIITGPMLQLYLAHLLLMKAYSDNNNSEKGGRLAWHPRKNLTDNLTDDRRSAQECITNKKQKRAE